MGHTRKTLLVLLFLFGTLNGVRAPDCDHDGVPDDEDVDDDNDGEVDEGEPCGDSDGDGVLNMDDPDYNEAQFEESTNTVIPTYPSCLTPNISWNIKDMISVTPSVETPELCQRICKAEPRCVALTWTDSFFPVFPLSCVTYSSTDNITQCENCISGPPVCPCSIPGRWEALQDNTDKVSGILVIGSSYWSTSSSFEFWSPANNTKEENRTLADYPRNMQFGPTANFVAGHLVACHTDSCERYDNGAWIKIANTRSGRYYHSSAQSDDRILLIGGIDSRSTEWIPMDGGPSKQGSFDVRHGGSHCTIQVSSDVIVVTGGHYSFDYVTEYKLAGDATETVMTPLITGRHGHACGVYGQADGQQMLLATGGQDDYKYILSTEVAVYSAGSPLVWIEVEGGELPTPRIDLRVTVVNNVLYITGGSGEDKRLTSVLSWDPAGQTWQEVGNLTVARDQHAAVAVSTSFIDCM